MLQQLTAGPAKAVMLPSRSLKLENQLAGTTAHQPAAVLTYRSLALSHRIQSTQAVRSRQWRSQYQTQAINKRARHIHHSIAAAIININMYNHFSSAPLAQREHLELSIQFKTTVKQWRTKKDSS